MKYIKYLLFVFFFLVFIDVKAIDACTEEEMARLKELANNVEIKYNYEVTNEYKSENKDEESFVEGVFKLQIVNDDKDLKYIMKYDGSEYELNINELNEYSFDAGDVITFNIYSYTPNLCTHSLLKTYTLKLPYYSVYYHFNKDKCSKTPNFKYCKEYLDESEPETFAEIEKELNNYTNNDSKDNNTISKNNFLVIMILIILAIVLGISGFFVSKQIKTRKNDDL